MSKKLIYPVVGLTILVAILLNPYFRPFKKAKDWNGVVKQRDSYSCGFSSLKMILNYYQIDINDSIMRNDLEMDKERGTTLLSMKKYAAFAGLETAGWIFTYEDLQKTRLPAIVLFNNTHYVVLDSIKTDSIYIRDPLKGRVILDKSNFLNKWDGVTLIFKK